MVRLERLVSKSALRKEGVKSLSLSGCRIAGANAAYRGPTVGQGLQLCKLTGVHVSKTCRTRTQFSYG